jgi:sugar phosphate isomerase/epimerase
MQIGIFAKTFARPSLEGTLDAVTAQGIETIQFNFSCAGLPTVPENIEPAVAQRICSEMEQRSLRMGAISGTCNLIHPNPVQRAANLKRLEQMIVACPLLGTSCVTLCTGTRDAEDMWRAHPENSSAAAWHHLLTSLSVLIPIAEKHGVVLGIEPEPANVINSAERARCLLDEMRSPALKIIFDAANLIPAPELKHQEHILRKAFELLGSDIVLAHAKDVAPGAAPEHVAAGKGALNYSLYIPLLEQSGYDGPLILHSLAETEVSGSIAFLRKQLDRAAARLAPNANA